MMGLKLAESQARFRLLARRAVLTRAGQDRSEDPEVELNRIEAALRRIDDGRYGVCDACGAAIASQMLIAKNQCSLQDGNLIGYRRKVQQFLNISTTTISPSQNHQFVMYLLANISEFGEFVL